MSLALGKIGVIKLSFVRCGDLHTICSKQFYLKLLTNIVVQKHQAVRLPLMKGSAPTTPSAFKFPQTTPNAISSANSTPEVKRTKMAPPPNNHSFLTSTAINNDSQNCHESKSDELISKG